MKAIVYDRSPSRYVIANVASRLGKASVGAGPVQLRDIPAPAPPGDEWVKVKPVLSGICGSDLAAVSGRSSGYFEQVVSFPFVLGHEVVGTLDDGTRVVVQPSLGCSVRGIAEPCPSCAEGFPATCHNTTLGDIPAGLQTGFCASTGGGWSESLVAHQSQLHTIPDYLSDDDALIVEPAACAIHAVKERAAADAADVVVIGAGTLGLLVTAALRHVAKPKSVTVVAKHGHQRRLASDLGASVVVPPKDLVRNIRAFTGAMLLDRSLLSPARLSGGVDVVIDCVGTTVSMTQALAVVRPRGRVVLVGMPGNVSFDMAPLWQREIELVAAYCYRAKDFAAAIELSRAAQLGRLVTHRYPLTRFHDAIEHAANAGARGAVKVAFDLRARAGAAS